MRIQSQIVEKLREALSPSLLNVVNESHRHAVPEHSETHFKITVVASAFDNKRPVARHQLIYQLLADELAGPVHALAIHAYTDSEWRNRGEDVNPSPDCKGGSTVID